MVFLLKICQQSSLFAVVNFLVIHRETASSVPLPRVTDHDQYDMAIMWVESKSSSSTVVFFVLLKFLAVLFLLNNYSPSENNYLTLF